MSTDDRDDAPSAPTPAELAALEQFTADMLELANRLDYAGDDADLLALAQEIEAALDRPLDP